MFPGLPASLHHDLVIGGIDQECQARVITRLGRPWGCWLDDTTPSLDHWIELTVAKYTPVGQKVLVCVPPGRPDHHYPPPIISVYEAYIYGMGCPVNDWLPLPKFEAYCVQHNYPGTHGKTPPTPLERKRLLDAALKYHPSYVFQF